MASPWPVTVAEKPVVGEDPALSLESSIGFAHARAGYIIPAGNRLIEPQFRHFSPPCFEAHVARLQMNGKYHKPLPQLLDGIARAASTLGDVKVDLIGFHCTATSMEHGPEGEAKIRETITKETGIPAISTGQAVMEAFRALSIKCVILITPYPQLLNDHEIEFLRVHGIEVVHDVALAAHGNPGLSSLISPARWLEIARANARDNADAYFLSCAGTTQIDTISSIEREFKKPVVNSNQAMLWATFNRLTEKLGPLRPTPALGRLWTKTI